MEYKYYWDFRIYKSPYSENYGYRCPDSLDEETKEAWQRYVFHVVSGLMTEDTMRNPEFQKILEEVRVRFSLSAASYRAVVSQISAAVDRDGQTGCSLWRECGVV